MVDIIITQRDVCQHKSLDAVNTKSDENVWMELKDRIRKARKDAKLSQPALAKLCGWESQSRISNYETGERIPSLSDLRLIANALSLSVSALTDDVSILDENVKDSKRSTGLVPKISWVRAGDLCDVDDPYEPGDAKEWMICPVKHGPRTYVLQVDGPSMDSGDADGYPDKYDIFVDPDVEARHGDDVVVRTPLGRATFKRLQIDNEGKFLLALNPNWPERIIKVPEGTVICGVVIYAGKPRRK